MWPEELQIVPEKTNYEKTSTHADVIRFLQNISATSKNISVFSMGRSLEGRDIPVAILANPMVATAAEAKASGKLIVYIQGNIHAGEVEGKEAAMLKIRNILAGENNPLFEKLIILFAPIYNSDSNDKMAYGRRPSQENSPPEVGIRENSQGLDLNRDGMKMEAIETNALFKVINEWDPMIFVDLHTTNGTWHAYDLTWAPSYQYAGEDITYNQTWDMLNDITDAIQKKHNLFFGPYGDYDLREGWPVKNFYTYNHHPRYLVNQFGLRNRLAILSEAFSHRPFEMRTKSTYYFVEEILGYAAEHSEEIKQVTKEAERLTLEGVRSNVKKGVRFKMVPSGGFDWLPSYDYKPETQADGTIEYKPTKDRINLPNVTYYAGFEATVESTVPAGYIIPRGMPEIAENLKKHGIKVTELTKTNTYTGEVFEIEKYETAQRKFEGHNMARATGKFKPAQKKFRKGDFVVDLAQPLGNLAFYLLEPESDDGLVTWNFFDKAVESQKEHNKPITYPVFKYYNTTK